MPNETPVVFHDGSNYDYHFIIKKSDFEGIFERLGENTGKFKTLSVPIEKEVTKIKKKDRNESVVSISEKMKFTDSARFIPTSLKNLVDSLTEQIRKTVRIAIDFLNMKVSRTIQ